MIREPKVGMRVQVSEESGWLRGEKGTIVTADGSDRPKVKPDSGFSKWVYNKYLTEIKENNMYLDEALKVVRENSDMELSWGSQNVWFGFAHLYKSKGFINWYSNSDFSVRAKPKEKQYCEYCGKKLD